MAVLITSNNYSGQTADVTLYAPTGYTIPYNNVSATTINVGSQVLPFTYQADYEPMEYGVFSLYFSSFDKTCTTSQISPPDGDGNVYNIIKIGNQVWMAENLRTTKFQDGTPLNNTSPVDDATWEAANGSTTKYWSYVNGDSGNTETYGLLYNQYAVIGSTTGSTPSNNLCPLGWHIPTLADIETLQLFVCGVIDPFQSTGGGLLKHPGVSYWDYPSGFETNSTGYSAVGSGIRFSSGNYASFKLFGQFWCTNINTFYIFRSYDDIFYTRDTQDIRSGLCVRCLKD